MCLRLFAFLFFMTALPCLALAEPINFDLQTIDASLSGPYAVRLADVDNDGDNDAIVASFNLNSIVWYENSAGIASTWVEHTVATQVQGAFALDIADINGDGFVDIQAAALLDDSIAWFENPQDTGVWTEHAISDNADAPQSVFTIDVDGDTDFDVISASQLDNKVAWYENVNGMGTQWAEHVITTTLSRARAVVAGDFDGIAGIDVVGASLTDDQLVLYRNTLGDGSSWTTSTLTGGVNAPESLYAVNLDGDGDLDILVGSTQDDSVSWVENVNGDGSTWTLHNISMEVKGARSIIAADLDLDNDLDIISSGAVTSLGNRMAWFDNTSGDASTWVARPFGAAAQSSRAIDVGRLEEDLDVDVLVGSTLNQSVIWYRNRFLGPLTYFQYIDYLLGRGGNPLGMDINVVGGDGEIDAADLVAKIIEFHSQFP